MKFSKPAVWDVVYALDMAVACLITYWVMAFLLPHWFGWPSTSVGVLWAVISTVFYHISLIRTHVPTGAVRWT